MINITLPDGSVKVVAKNSTPYDVACQISEGLARAIVSAKFNDSVVETSTPLVQDGSLKLFTWNDDEGKQVFWHSSAHILAQSILYFYPNAKLTIGPSIANGFYYDVDFGNETISESDFIKIENQFLEFARQKFEFKMRSVSKVDALQYYKARKNEYKVELIENLTDGEITFCDHADFTDLCRGGHLPNTGFVKAVKIRSSLTA